MSRPAPGSSRFSHAGSLALVLLALAFPISLAVFNPTLMFERGWEQYAGTLFYLVAVVLLGREVFRLRADHLAFTDAPALLDDPARIDDSDQRLLPARIRGLTRSELSLAQVVELNREASALDQDHAAGRFTLPRYILYLLPVIGFIGTVEGISKALRNISNVLPMVKELDGFLANLTGVTDALNIAFDSTLLALFLSAALMLLQTVVQRGSEDLLTRVDRWVVEHVLARAAAAEQRLAHVPVESGLREQLDRVEVLLERLTDDLAGPIDRFAGSVDRLPAALAVFQKGAASFEGLGERLESVSATGDAVRKAVATLARIETALAAGSEPDEQLEQIRRSVDRSCLAIEGLAGQMAQAFERNSRVTQEQLARTLGSLKDALDLLQVSMEQGNALYRSIVKKMFPLHGAHAADDRAA